MMRLCQAMIGTVSIKRYKKEEYEEIYHSTLTFVDCYSIDVL